MTRRGPGDYCTWMQRYARVRVRALLLHAREHNARARDSLSRERERNGSKLRLFVSSRWSSLPSLPPPPSPVPPPWSVGGIFQASFVPRSSGLEREGWGRETERKGKRNVRGMENITARADGKAAREER